MLNDVVIRQINIGDLPQCESHFPAPFKVSYRTQIIRQSNLGYSLYGVFVNGQLAAMAHVRRQGPKDANISRLYPHPVMGNLFVVPKYRARGLAKLLLDHCESSLKSEGYHTVGLIVSVANHAAVKLYQGLGYQPKQQFQPRPGRSESYRTYYIKHL